MSVVVLDRAHVTLGSRTVLDDVSFTIRAGEVIGLLGPNGAGKTTLMRALLGLVPVRSGRIEVLGRPPGRGNHAIGYLPQFSSSAARLPLTGYDLLVTSIGGARWGRPFASRADREAVATALRRVGATALARRPISELSGGERQRLLVAQALIGEPRLLLLDEPLSSLDPAQQQAMVALVGGIARERGIAVLLAAHEVNPLLPAIDRVLYLGNGQAAIGPVDEVARTEVLSQLYGAPVEVVRAGDRIFVLSGSAMLDGHDPHEHDPPRAGDAA